MKITIISEIDYAASGYKLHKALQSLEHDIQIFTGRYQTKYNLPQVPHHTKRYIQKHIDASDIIHLKGDWPPKDGYLGLKIMHRPIIITVSGSHFRKKEYWGYGKYDMSLYKSAVMRTAFTPDLLYPEFSDIWTPHPIDSIKHENEWKCAAHPVLIHTPTIKDNKDTEFVRAVFQKLSRRMKIEPIILENIQHKEIIKLRKEATIFFDQFRVGFYGNSALEAMQFGVPVAAWISPFAQKRANLAQCPILSAPKKVDIWAEMIEKTLDSDILWSLSAMSKKWCDEVHSYQAVAKLWKKIYESVSLEI